MGAAGCATAARAVDAAVGAVAVRIRREATVESIAVDGAPTCRCVARVGYRSRDGAADGVTAGDEACGEKSAPGLSIDDELLMRDATGVSALRGTCEAAWFPARWSWGALATETFSFWAETAAKETSKEGAESENSVSTWAFLSTVS